MNKKVITLMCLMAVFIVMLVWTFRTLGVFKASPSAKKTQIAEEDELLEEEFFWKKTGEILAKIREKEEPLGFPAIATDPMKAGISREFSFCVSAILLNENRAVVIINDKILRVGDIIEGEEIIAIEKNRVILQRGTEEHIIEIEK